MTAEGERPGERLNRLLLEAGLAALDPQVAGQFEMYLSLIVRWNARINLTSIRDEEGILTRHFVESIACARALPSRISTLLDFGSGAGFPGIPIALCRPQISITLAESQGKKAAFLQEAVRVLGLTAKVHAGRADTLEAVFDCVTMRAVDHMSDAVGPASSLVAAGGWLALMTSSGELERLKSALGAEFQLKSEARLPGSVTRLLALVQRDLSSPQSAPSTL